MMLHLRRAASSDSQRSPTTLFGSTTFSTRIIWARRTAALDLSSPAFSPDEHLANERDNVDRSNEDEEAGERIELRSYRVQ
ncbi:hypothetical protein M407DRAFT_243845 [Tulasnella calospora MUT 4182]|uniref:Uncharacterized protein n=1 Tax=Tulasnella calospora MUT 4182 TaxID=1051891 RepID=A0A0C3QHN5_9AGAM|nr:hypothetical protein M407DRAFT_243845 [Tulasnella calospora MUT 4182]